MDQWIVFVSSPAMLDDIKHRPDDQLSLIESFKDVSGSYIICILLCRLTYGDQSTQLDQVVDPHVLHHQYHVDMVTSKLTRALPALMPHIVEEMCLAVAEYIPAGSEGTFSADRLS